MLLVTGATGNTGQATLEALLARDQPVRALVRDPEAELPFGADRALGAFDDPASLNAALEGVTAAFLVCASGPAQVELESAFIDAAAAAGVSHVVRVSILGADREADRHRLVDNHRRLEEHLEASGMRWTHLRCNEFMQNLLLQAAPIREHGSFISPLQPATRVSYLDVADVGEVAAAALLDGERHAGRAHLLTGGEALTDDEVAAALSEATGAAVSCSALSPTAYGEALREVGVPDWKVDALLELYAFYDEGHAGVVSDAVGEVTGRAPRTMLDFAARHRAAFAF